MYALVLSGQNHKYFVCNILCQPHYRKKTFGGYVRGTIGIQTKSMPTLIPRPGGRITAFMQKTGVKYDFLMKKRIPVHDSLSKKYKMA